MSIDCANAVGESLPFLDSSFDLVVSADFLEHVSSLDSVFGECSRVLKPSGIFSYDPVNRMLRSRIVAVRLFERVIGLIPRHTHDPNMFIKPAERCEVRSRHGISNRETRGLSPQGSLLGALVGFMNDRHVAFSVTDDTAISEAGYAIKAG